jgi:hypothetical protein
MAEKMLRIAAIILTYVFHPLLMFTYMLLLLLLVNPYMFGVNHVGDQIKLLAVVFLYSFFMPALAMVMMKALGFVKTFDMKDRYDRIVPYIGTAVFYVAIFYLLYKSPDVPQAYKVFTLGGVIGLFAAFFMNNFTKVSIHAVGMGGLLTMTILTMALLKQSSFPLNSTLFGTMRVSMSTVLLLVILFTGLVGTARLYLKAHTAGQLWGGYLIGIASQIVAFWVLYS